MTPKTSQDGVTNLPAIVKDLQAIVDPARISITTADRDQHSRDQSSHPARLPDLVIWPQTTTEVSAILAYANNVGLPIVGWGAGSSLEGNPIPVRGGFVLNFREMNQILTIHENDFQVTVQPGIFYKDMNKILARHGLFFAPDPGANASIGGMIANNASGIRTVKYGATRDNVLALEVVQANGQALRTGSRSVKQSSGYDLTHLFIGSEGTLGIITEATLKLAPLPEHFSAVIAAFPTVNKAAETVFNVIGGGLNPAALELLDTVTIEVLNNAEPFDLTVAPTLLMEFNGASEAALNVELGLVEEICQANGCQAFEAGIGREARNRLWKARHQLGEVLIRSYPEQTYLITDVAVPISQYQTLVTTANELRSELDVRGNIFGHAGDGNLHTMIFFPADNEAMSANAKQFNHHLVEKAITLGGTCTGEHGVGLGKQQYMEQEHGPIAMGLMRDIKAVLDPKGILNPGKVLGI